MTFSNYPVGDFSKEEVREGMQNALAALGKKTFDYKLVIGGECQDGDGSITSLNPSTGQPLGTCARASRKHVEEAVAAAKNAFEAWRDLSPADRAAHLRSIAQKMEAKIYDLSALIVLEAGKTWRESHADVAEAIDFLYFYAESISSFEGRKTQDVLAEDNVLSYIPKGVVGVIAPWNFPLAILTGMAAAALVTGNTVVMKPSSDTPLIAAQFMDLCSDLPSGVLNFVPCQGSVFGEVMTASPDVAMVAFTGSKDVGLELYRGLADTKSSAQQVKTMVCEMGGKNAVIVDDTADLDAAIPGVMYSAFGYQGQKCSACSRLLVHTSIYDHFLERLLGAAKSYRVDDASSPGSDLGPIINEDAYKKILSYISSGVEQGGTLLLDGREGVPEGWYIGPTIIEAKEDNVVSCEEVFGPLLSVIKIESFEEGLRLLNSSDYALTGGLFSRTPKHIDAFKKGAFVGNRYINRGITGAVVERQPFGGFKLSGMGSKAGSKEYLLHFLYPVTTTEEQYRHGHVPDVEKYSTSS